MPGVTVPFEGHYFIFNFSCSHKERSNQQKKVPKRKSFTAQSGSRTSSKPIIVVVRRTYAFGTYWKKCDRSVTPISRDSRKKKRDLEAFDLEVVGWMVVWFGPFGIVWGS